MEYKLHHYNGEIHPIEELEDILSDIYTKPNYSFVKMVDSILPMGTYIAVVHYTIDTEEVEPASDPRVSSTAEL